jgi:hypothetical protein
MRKKNLWRETYEVFFGSFEYLEIKATKKADPYSGPAFAQWTKLFLSK